MYHKKKNKIKTIFSIKNNKNANKKDILYQRKILNDNKKFDKKCKNNSFLVTNKSSFINSKKLNNNKIDFLNQTKDILNKTKNKFLYVTLH